MFVQPEDLLVLAGRGGRPFEELLYDLIVAEAGRHGIPASDVSWDHRTTVPDGGRDIIVKTTHAEIVHFIPQRSSIWSAKSGRDGIQPSTLSAELIAPSHTAIREHLQRGNPYVWCTLQPMCEDDKVALRAKVTEIANYPNCFKFEPDLIEFRDLPTLCTTLNENPGLIAKHLPNAARVFESALSLREWEAEDGFGFATPFVDFGGRLDVVGEVRSHLRERKGGNVLHLAGLSGIGKTRTVLEACRGESDLNCILYIPRRADFHDRFLRHLTRNSRVRALIVIDEVPLEDVRSLTSQVERYSDRIRIITIGPARRNSGSRPAANILVLQEPQTTEGVLQVIRGVAGGISDLVLESIAQFSAHDLRLALMLLDATRQDGNFRDLPIQDGDDVWRRVTNLFRTRLDDVTAFQTHYPYLTFAIDIGVEGELRREVEEVATQFGVEVQRLDEAIDAAASCGLGIRSTAFFESTPRALAGHLFRQRVWGQVRLRLSQFAGELPDRLLRRFIERCQECTGPERHEMEEALDLFFQQGLGKPGLTQLVDRTLSRLFKAWAELDPVRGLEWLRRAVNSASDTQLAEFSGNPDASGGWGGRRQIVWLCESLASFGEHFWNCEAVLFRLAQVETEPSIGNNSSKIWKSMFHPTFAFTEIPFQERSDLLLRRLQESDLRTFDLIFSAVEEALVGGSASRIIPPAIVGGRLVPEPWRPSSHAELYRSQRTFAQQVLDVVGQLPTSMRQLAGESLLSHLGSFVRFHLVPQLRVLLDPHTEDIREAIHVEVLGILEDCNDSDRDPRVNQSLLELREWEDALRPKSLEGQIRELTSQDYWNVMRSERRTSKDTTTSPYFRLAEQIVGKPEVFLQLEEWLSSPAAKSCFALALALGSMDRAESFGSLVMSWLVKRRCLPVVSGYLRGMATRLSQIPDVWADHLDNVTAEDAGYIASVTADADFSRRGLMRIVRLVEAGTLQPVFCNTFLNGAWEPILGQSERLELLEMLLALSSRQVDALDVALKLMEWWTDFGKAIEPELEHVAVRLLRSTLDVRSNAASWSHLLKSLSINSPGDAAELAAMVLSSDGSQLTRLRHLIMPTLVELASSHPEQVMDALGRRILDPENQSLFRLLKFENLFDAIGLNELQRWFSRQEPKSARLIARHLSSPTVQNGFPIIPPVTDWMLTTFGDDEEVFDEFLRGRHAFEVREGHARDRRSELEQTLAPFRAHDKAWIRRWAEYELKENDRDAHWDDYLDDRLERM